MSTAIMSWAWPLRSISSRLVAVKSLLSLSFMNISFFAARRPATIFVQHVAWLPSLYGFLSMTLSVLHTEHTFFEYNGVVTDRVARLSGDS